MKAKSNYPSCKFLLGIALAGIIPLLVFGISGSPVALAQEAATPVPNLYFTVNLVTLSDGTVIEENIINGPPVPPPGFEFERQPVLLPEPDSSSGMYAANSLTVPAFNWVFGCSSVSGAMVAGYYDRNGYPNMYTGPTNGGVMPLDNSSWLTWSDGSVTYPNLPLAASKNGVDGRSTKGSIDDYWVLYGSSASDPYITGSWGQHSWGTAIGDYMKTSQSAFGNTDGSTTFYTYISLPGQLTCATMAGDPTTQKDGTLGRKQFYEARGYTVTDCYNQKTDNNGGGFTFAMYKTEINAGRPVMINLEGHTVVGVGYDDTGNTVYIHDTWDYSNHTMTWGGIYTEDMVLQSVSIVNLSPVSSESKVYLPLVIRSWPPGNQTLTVSKGGTGSGTVTSSPPGINCGSTCSYGFAYNTVVTLTATPTAPSTFGGWSEAGCSGTGNCIITMSAAQSVSATFNSPGSGIVNGDFESGRIGWTEDSSHDWPIIMDSGFPAGVTPHSGSWAAWLGGDNDETAYIQQQVTISAGAPYLTYYHWIASADFCGYDFGEVLINGSPIDYYDLCTSTTTGGWVKHSLDLSAYAGQSVTLQIGVETDLSDNSNLFVDDVSFQGSASPSGSLDGAAPNLDASTTQDRSGIDRQGVQ